MAKKVKNPVIRGKRNTTQRRILLDIINQTGGHLDAGELYLKARKIEPSISLSTVYRNLRLFKELGLIEERHFTEEHHLYEAKPDIEHYHFVCLNCGNVTEFTSPIAEVIKNQVSIRNRFDVLKTEIRLEGYCERCRKNLNGWLKMSRAAVPADRRTTIARMKPGQRAVVVEMPGGYGLLRRLQAIGIRQGVRVRKISSMFGRGPVTIQVDGTQITLGHGMADKIIVELDNK
jgi:Fe2+ or Zn2+ uptake regulation protein/Fe2+ transport system protein FeoA